jgi:hypothetical protein
MDDRHKVSVALAYLLSKKSMEITAKEAAHSLEASFTTNVNQFQFLYFSPKRLETSDQLYQTCIRCYCVHTHTQKEANS